MTADMDSVKDEDLLRVIGTGAVVPAIYWDRI